MNTRSLRHWFRSLFLESNRSFYLSVFRVLLSLVILGKICIVWSNTNFLFGPNGLLNDSAQLKTLGIFPLFLARDNPHLFLGAYASVACLMLFGIGRRWSVAIVTFATEIFQDLNWFLLDGGDNLLQFSLYYLVLGDSFAHFSVRAKKTSTTDRLSEYSFSNFCTHIAVVSIIAHLCLVYTVSGFSKAHSEVWYNGTAMYYILLGERFQGLSWNEYLAKNAVLTTVACYIVIVWESTFVFAVFVKRIRMFVLLIGVCMHMGIYIFMMIHSFQLLYILNYGFFFTNQEWKTFLAKVLPRVGLKVPAFDL